MHSVYKSKAIQLRKQGLTYTEIAVQVPVSRATLSLWLRDVPVPDSYAPKIQALKMKAVKAGWEARRNDRLARIESIKLAAKSEVKVYSLDPLWLVGLTLYWAEGSKEKSWSKGVLVTFTNMDEKTISLFKKWCIQFLHTTEDDFAYSLYLHESRESDALQFVEWWGELLSVPTISIPVYYKRTKITHVRHNDADGYRGVFRLQVKRSVDKNRKIAAWIEYLAESLNT
ncbi:hypothetical protein BH11PAT2_BH11PAT2_05260 [soil metagenome]